MHALDLNLFQHHCRVLFQIDLTIAGGDGAALVGALPTRKNKLAGSADMKKCLHLVRKDDSHLLFQLLELHRKVLYTFCWLYDIKAEHCSHILGSKWVLAKNIYAWVRFSFRFLVITYFH